MEHFIVIYTLNCIYAGKRGLMTAITKEIIGATDSIINNLNDAIKGLPISECPYVLSHFLSQLKVESNFQPKEENLMYGTKRMQLIFGRRGKRKLLYSHPERYARNPKNLANYVYANRMGNGDSSSGDGGNYRGRGLIQLTGKDNYRAITGLYRKTYKTTIDFLASPDLLLEEKYATKSAVLFWEMRDISSKIKRGKLTDVGKVTSLVNGGRHGLRLRQKYFDRYLPKIKKSFLSPVEPPKQVECERASNDFTEDELIAIRGLLNE